MYFIRYALLFSSDVVSDACSLDLVKNRLWALWSRHATVVIIILYLMYTQVSMVVRGVLLHKNRFLYQLPCGV